MNEEKEQENNKLIAKNQMLESDNKILAQRLKEKNNDLNIVNNLYKKEKEKFNKIYNVLSQNKVNESNYLKAIDWVMKALRGEV